MSLLPTDDKERKNLPIWRMITRYFPKAFREITRVCVANNVRYNPERDPADINWARGKSRDQLGSSFRHMMEAEVDGKVFEDEPSPVDGKPLYILAENAWRALAALEIAIEEQEAKKPYEPLVTDLPSPPLYCLWRNSLTDQPLRAPQTGCSCAVCDKVRGQSATGV